MTLLAEKGNPLENKENKLCQRCEKNKATLTFADNFLSFVHGFSEQICKECYDKQIRGSEAYKKGWADAIEEIEKMVDVWWAKRTSEKGATFEELKKQIKKLKEKDVQV